MLGITLFSWGATWFGFKLPEGMSVKHLVVASCVAGIGLTVALFVSGQAFVDSGIQGAAKMGSLFSACAFLVAWILAKSLGVGPSKKEQDEEWFDATASDAVNFDTNQSVLPDEIVREPDEELVESGI